MDVQHELLLLFFELSLVLSLVIFYLLGKVEFYLFYIFDDLSEIELILEDD